MTALEGRITRLELMIQRLQMQIATLNGQATTFTAQGRQMPAPLADPGGGGGGGGAFVCLSPPAIAAGGSNVMDVYLISGGATVLATAGATVYNEYNSPVAAGKVITLCRNNDGTYIVYGQSCL